MHPLFVYGTLRPDLYPHRGLHGVSGTVAVPSTSWSFWNIGGKYPALVVKPEGGNNRTIQIVGQIIMVEDLNPYDLYETGYIRDQFRVIDFARQQIMACVYYMPEENFVKLAKAQPTRLIQSGDWADEIAG